MLKNLTYHFVIISLIVVGISLKSSAQNIEFTENEKNWIKNNPVIDFGYEPNWPPYEIYEDGEYKGIVGDYLNIIARETGIEFKPIPNITWEESLKKLQSGKIIMAPSVAITSQRKEYLNFTTPYITSPLVIVTKKDAPFIGCLKDLKNKTVSLPKYYNTAELLQRDFPDIKIDYHQGVQESLKALSMGKSDAVVANLVVISYYIKHSGFSNLKIAAPTVYDNDLIAFGVTKKSPELISIIQKVMDNISYEEKNSILQKWILVRYEYGVDVRLMWKIGVYSLVAILVIVGGFLFWNETLRKEIKNREQVEAELADTLKEISSQNDERKNLLNEIHHRLKNNLHMISGMLKLQSLDSGNKEVEKQLNEAVERIRSIALVHERIYKSQNDKNLNFEDFVKPLIQELIDSFSANEGVKMIVDCKYDLRNTNPLPSLALILNELATNSLKYAFKSKSDVREIKVTISESDEIILMSYADNGKWISNENKSSLGLSLIDIFSEQLGGTYTRTTENGTCYKFSFSNFYNDEI